MSNVPTVQKEEIPPLNWAVVAVFGLSFLAAVTVVPWYGIVHGYNGWSWLFFGVFLALNGIGIGSGYHRLWSHRTYEAHPALKWFLAVMGGMALQNRVIIWSARLRVHLRDVVDNDTPNFAPAGNIVAGVPTGTGILIMANRNVHVFDNDLGVVPVFVHQVAGGGTVLAL